MNRDQEFNYLWLVVLVTLVVLGLLVVFFWDFVSTNVIMPIYTAAIIIVYGVNSVQQSIYLFFLILIAGAIAVIFLGSTFSRARMPEYRGYAQYSIEIDNPYAFWQMQCRNLARNAFANEEFARVSRKLLIDLLAYQEHRDAEEIEMMVIHHEMALPPAVQYVIENRKLNASAQEPNWFQRQWYRLLRIFHLDTHTPTPESVREVEAIITFLEQRLEISQNDEQESE
ncbi:MAG: hypothetical protein V2J07_07800 [Anaerolineae bacterium]|jgi:hypothetical protein|nr:hypothetical protein [Anaerolineae bacterium]